MGDGSEHSSQSTTADERPAISLPQRPTPIPSSASSSSLHPRLALARVIPRRPRVSFWFGMTLALVFALLVTPAVTAERWLGALGLGEVTTGEPAPITIRVAPFSGVETLDAHIGGGGIVIGRGEIAGRDEADNARDVLAAMPKGPLPYLAFAVLAFVFAAIFSHHMRRSTKGRLLRVQIVSLVTVAALAIAVKVLMLATTLSLLVVPVALLAMVPTMVLDRVVGLATGVLAALVVSLLIPFDVTIAIVLLVQAATAGLVIAEHPKSYWRAALSAGAVTTLFTAGTVVLLAYLTTGAFPQADDPWRSPLVAAALGPAIATLLAVPTLPIYQLLVGEITKGKLIELEDLSHPLLKQIAEKSPGTWQHSLTMANMAEIAANAIGANGRLVRVGAYYHDLGKSLQPKYFIENLEPGETSPHDQLPPEVSCDAIFAHVTEGIVTARKAGLHERIVDFMHMHHGDGVLEYFWSRCQEQGNPRGFSVDNFRYPGHPPQSRETAILAICDAVEAASRTLKKPDAASIGSLVQRIVYGKLHLGQLDESGLSMADLRRISDSLRETIRHANHGRIEYPWQKAQQDASATRATEITGTQPRLDSLDRQPRRDTTVRAAVAVPLDEEPIPLDRPSRPSSSGKTQANVSSPEALAATADLRKPEPDSDQEITRKRPKTDPPPEGVRVEFRKKPTTKPPLRPRTESEINADASQRIGRPRTESEINADASGRIRRPHTESGSGDVGEARKKAATLPPAPRTRAPTVPPIGMMVPPPGGAEAVSIPPVPTPSSSLPAVAPVVDIPASRAGGPPPHVDLENAVTNPPPVRRTKQPPLATRLPAFVGQAEDDLKVTAPRQPIRDDADAAITGERIPIHYVEDAGRTEPSLPKVALPLQPPPPSDASIALPDAGATLSGDPLKKAVDLAARLDSAGERDEWSAETPVVAPSKAELRALLGVPDVTRKQSLDELDRLHRQVAEHESDPEILRPPSIVDAPRPRALPQTKEVDPEDIEAAIELAPPARRNAIATAKPKKPPQ